MNAMKHSSGTRILIPAVPPALRANHNSPTLLHLTRATHEPTNRSIRELQSVPYSTYHQWCALSRWLTFPVNRLFGRTKSPSSLILYWDMKFIPIDDLY